jgi:hypothetical protein
MESVMFSDRYEIADQLTKLIELSKKYDKDRSSILFDLQNIVDEINTRIDEEAVAYEMYQDKPTTIGA